MRLARAVGQLLNRLGLRLAPAQGPTHRGRHGNRRLDIFVVSAADAAIWEARRRWRAGLSDHAALVGRS
eukprot:9824183-Lingulodinium_polyedra.AAC.1